MKTIGTTRETQEVAANVAYIREEYGAADVEDQRADFCELNGDLLEGCGIYRNFRNDV